MYRNLDWVFCVFDPEHGVKIVEDRRLSYNPYVMFRWNTIDDESMGRGVILDAMGNNGRHPPAGSQLALL
jgi:hypothetical protein